MQPLRSTHVSLLFPLALAAACGSHAATPGTAPPSPPTGPAPSLSEHDRADGDFSISFESTGLPAVTGDAANVALAVMDVDGPMSPPNLRLSVRDRADAEVHSIVVLSAKDGEAFAGGGDTSPHFDDGPLVAANRYLGDIHARRGWFSLTAMTLDEPPERADADDHMPRSAHLGAVALAWDEGHVKVTVDGKPVVDRQTSGWLAVPQPPPAGCDDCVACSNPSYLGQAWVDPARKVLVARIAYVGNDSCWEPPSQDHVISWE